MSAFDIDPGTCVPRIMTMTGFKLWTWNSRIFPDALGTLNIRPHFMRQRHFGNLSRCIRHLGRPIAECRAETMNRNALHPHAAQQHQHSHIGQRLVALLAFKHIEGVKCLKWLQ